MIWKEKPICPYMLSNCILPVNYLLRAQVGNRRGFQFEYWWVENMRFCMHDPMNLMKYFETWYETYVKISFLNKSGEIMFERINITTYTVHSRFKPAVINGKILTSNISVLRELRTFSVQLWRYFKGLQIFTVRIPSYCVYSLSYLFF